MRRNLCLFVGALTALSLAGCGGTIVRDGIWEITWNVQESSTRLPWDIPKRTVKVRVEKDPSGDGEILEMTPIGALASDDNSEGRHPALELRPMYGDVRVRREEEPPSLQVEAADAYWRWVMWGVVKSSEYISGTHFAARRRHGRQAVVLDGWWSMRWLRDG